MNDFNFLLSEVIKEAKRAKIPISDNISPEVIINKRAKKRFGQCKLENGRFIIELSDKLLDAPEKSCRQTLAHELIHTCPKCLNHGDEFKKYAYIMNRTYEYNIKRTSNPEEMGVSEEMTQNRKAKYILLCEKCGAEIGRLRLTQAIKYPSRYRCRCGGSLQRIK